MYDADGLRYSVTHSTVLLISGSTKADIMKIYIATSNLRFVYLDL